MFHHATVPILRNLRFPVCARCTHFVDMYPVPRCRRSGEVDLVTGRITYDAARQSREDAKRCGLRGTHYQELTRA